MKIRIKTGKYDLEYNLEVQLVFLYNIDLSVR